MASKKKRYRIYEDSLLDYGDGRTENVRKRIGETYAVSEAQAVNNFCYRANRKKFSATDWLGDGSRTTSIVAELDGESEVRA